MWMFGRKENDGNGLKESLLPEKEDEVPPFSHSSTAEEVTQGIDATGLTAIVTGASLCTGIETARVLAMRGTHVIMADCNVNSAREAKENILKEIPQAKIDVMELDLSSMASVRKFASDYNVAGYPLNILVNNRGIRCPEFMLSQDKIEMMFAVNHLGHFLLTNLLLQNMKNTARESKKEGRIINVSSIGHCLAYPEGIRFDEINDKDRHAFGQSKLAKILHANELATGFKEEGLEITANSVEQGYFATKSYGSCNYFASTGEGDKW